MCPQLVRIGGSHAQREVFEDTLLEAYLRAEQFDQAEAMLEERLARRASVRDTFWLGRCRRARDSPRRRRQALRQRHRVGVWEMRHHRQWSPYSDSITHKPVDTLHEIACQEEVAMAQHPQHHHGAGGGTEYRGS